MYHYNQKEYKYKTHKSVTEIKKKNQFCWHILQIVFSGNLDVNNFIFWI